MRNVFQLTLAIIAVTVAAPCVPSIAAAPKPVYKVLHESRVPVPMRDGVRLAAEVYRPDAPGRFPALMLLRYFREGNDRAPFFAQRGYAVALIDCRGRYDSEGTWVPYCNEPRDGFDAQEWLVARPWCDGKIGAFGISYNGFTQLMPAPLGSRYLKCLVPQECQQTNFGHLYNDGVMQLNVVFEFGLFTRQGSALQQILPVDDPHYRRLPLLAAVDNFAGVEHVPRVVSAFALRRLLEVLRNQGEVLTDQGPRSLPDRLVRQPVPRDVEELSRLSYPGRIAASPPRNQDRGRPLDARRIARPAGFAGS